MQSNSNNAVAYLFHHFVKITFIGHIQVAQVPDRHEPNTNGEIDYRYIFSLLEQLGYKGWIGLEYKPAGSTKDGLKWVDEFNMVL
jgi:hydroxypyruvate isomerase